MDPAAETSPQAEGIRLVALDLDGTLLSSDKQLPAATQRVIRKCAQRGVKVVLASARPPRAVRTVHRLLELDTLSIHYNGALICDLNANHHWRHLSISANLMRQIIELARRIDPQCLISIERLDRWYTDRFDHDEAGEIGRLNPPSGVGPLHEFAVEPATKLMLLDDPARIAPVRDAITALFGDRVGIAATDSDMIQIMHPEADKAHALQRVAANYGIEQRQVMAIGDAPNDCGMLRWAGLGVAVANAWVEVLDAADTVVPPNDVGGVAYAIQRYVLDAGSAPAPAA